MWITASGGPQTLLEYANFGITTYPSAGQIGWSQDGAQIDRIGGIGFGTDMMHLAVSIEGTAGTVYINGENKGLLDASSLNTTGDGRLQLQSFAEYDELAIYDRALTEAEVQAHYAAATG